MITFPAVSVPMLVIGGFVAAALEAGGAFVGLGFTHHCASSVAFCASLLQSAKNSRAALIAASDVSQ